ncbi:hypothetical protein IFM46972_03917 [Aspergillus udagawae]|uniref:Uncharacterized protein n=1 Tax=Aspergillus udagawae TaxID=91492 RepID=A0A8H3NG49_9EURO|nr:hypothetical protein IFM46972_03917 [Aspergillus udagawae]
MRHSSRRQRIAVYTSPAAQTSPARGSTFWTSHSSSGAIITLTLHLGIRVRGITPGQAHGAPKVGQFHRPVDSEEDILGFEIAVCDAAVMEVGDRAHDLLEEAVNVGERERGACCGDEGAEVAGGAVLRYQAELVAVVEERVDGAEDVGMGKGGGEELFEAVMGYDGRAGGASEGLDDMELFGGCTCRAGGGSAGV